MYLITNTLKKKVFSRTPKQGSEEIKKLPFVPEVSKTEQKNRQNPLRVLNFIR